MVERVVSCGLPVVAARAPVSSRMEAPMGMSRRVDIAQLFATVARDLTAQPGMSATADRVADVAAKLIGCGWAAVGRMGPHEALRFDATRDDSVLAAVESVAAETGQGIAAESLSLR